MFLVQDGAAALRGFAASGAALTKHVRIPSSCEFHGRCLQHFDAYCIRPRNIAFDLAGNVVSAHARRYGTAASAAAPGISQVIRSFQNSKIAEVDAFASGPAPESLSFPVATLVIS